MPLASFGQLIAIFLSAMTALYGMGMMSASLFLLLSREADHLAQLATEPVFLVSGFYFPIKSFNFWIAAAASIIPLTLGLDAMRQLVFATGASLGFLDVRVELGILIGLCVVFLVRGAGPAGLHGTAGDSRGTPDREPEIRFICDL